MTQAQLGKTCNFYYCIIMLLWLAMALWDDSAIFAKKRKMANAKVPGERKNWNKLQLPEIYTPVILKFR